MTRNQFKKQLVTYLNEIYGEIFHAGLTYTSVNNETGHECLSLKAMDNDYSITIDIVSLFIVFQNEGESFDLISDKILEYYKAFTLAAEEAAHGRIEKLKDHIYCRLVNYEMNRNKLSSIPYDKKLDMAVIYYYRLALSENETAGVVIDYSKFVNEENEELIKKAAWENTLRDEPAQLCPLSELIGAQDKCEMPVFVLSNCNKYFGAICMFYPGILKDIANTLDSDLYIIPSSIHECLLLPTECFESSAGIREIVHTVNRTELGREEILSDSVYLYRRKKDSISIDI